MTWTQQDIERWLSELGKECDGSEWRETYKFGFRDALTKVMIKMDEDRKRVTPGQ